VREPFEWDICHIPGAKLVPLGSLPLHMNEWDRAGEIVLLCKSGLRSAKALQLLKAAGFVKLLNVEGGIAAWAREVDPTMARY